MFLRKRNRLPNKILYQSNHRYFITICINNKKCILSDVTPNTVGYNENTISANLPCSVVAPNTVGHNFETYTLPLTEIGKIIETVRYQLPNMFWNVILDAFVIMPNHIHGIIGFDGVPYSAFTKKSTNLWNIIKRFKIETVNQTKQSVHFGSILPLRQHSFHDHIIRNEEELHRIQQYIIDNPLQREQDSFYTSIA